jgi:hypothetical protein
MSVNKKRKSIVRKPPPKPSQVTTIEWGVYKRASQPESGGNWVNSNYNGGCLLTGRTFEETSSVKALENAFSSIAQVLGEINLQGGSMNSSEIRICIKQG